MIGRQLSALLDERPAFYHSIVLLGPRWIPWCRVERRFPLKDGVEVVPVSAIPDVLAGW